MIRLRIIVTDITIFCRKKKDPGNQVRLKFKNNYDGLLKLEILEFKNFVSQIQLVNLYLHLVNHMIYYI